MTKPEVSTISDIAKEIERGNRIQLFPHISVDGDALGSSIALCLALKSLDKDCVVIIDDDIPDSISFLKAGNNCIVNSSDVKKGADLCICIDNGEISRIKDREYLFKSGKSNMCIDHHISTRPIFHKNLIDLDAAATAEIIFDLLNYMEIKINKSIGEALYTGILTDTGRFQYSNTTKKTHLIAGELMEKGIDQNKISVEIFQSDRIEKIRLHTKVMDTVELLYNGKVAIGYMSAKMLEQTNAREDESEGIVEQIRNIRGVEVSVFLKEKQTEEKEKNTTKVSMRSKNDFDVAEISQLFDGGGHTKAAGFTLEKNIEETKKLLLEQLDKKYE